MICVLCLSLPLLVLFNSLEIQSSAVGYGLLYLLVLDRACLSLNSSFISNIVSFNFSEKKPIKGMFNLILDLGDLASKICRIFNFRVALCSSTTINQCRFDNLSGRILGEWKKPYHRVEIMELYSHGFISTKIPWN